METKHTPGPWRASKGGPNGCPVVGTERGLMVCMLSHSVDIPSHIEQAKANVALIAAAPDLLEICQRVLDRGYVCKSIEEEKGDHLALVSAIAKATGAS